MVGQLLTLCDSLGIPAAYGSFKKPQVPPFVCILGDGEQTTQMDNKVYHRVQYYTVEYYFIEKDEQKEFALEDAFVEHGFIYTKSEDIYIESENVYEIQYTVWRSIRNGRSE